MSDMPSSSLNIDKNIGKKIKALRLEHEMSQKELAEKLGVSFQQVQKYEKGTNRLSVGRLDQLCSIFAISMDVFMGNKTYSWPKSFEQGPIILGEQSSSFHFESTHESLMHDMMETFKALPTLEKKQKALAYVKKLEKEC
jgi:transcriptional regulator with XRE-family HTH domain